MSLQTVPKMLMFNGNAEGKEKIESGLDTYLKISDEPIDLNTVSFVAYSRMIDGPPMVAALDTKDQISIYEPTDNVIILLSAGDVHNTPVIVAREDVILDDINIPKGVYIYYVADDIYVSNVGYTVEANVENKALTFNGDATGMETIADGSLVKISDIYVEPQSIISATGVLGGTTAETMYYTEFAPLWVDMTGNGAAFLLLYNDMPMCLLVSTRLDLGEEGMFDPGVYVINIPGDIYISEIQYYVELPPEYDWFRHLFLNEAKASLDARINTEAEALRGELDTANSTISQQTSTINELSENLETANNTIVERDNTIVEKDATIAEKDATIAEKDATISKKNATIAELMGSSEPPFALDFWDDRTRSNIMSNMFYGCTSLTSIPLFDTSNVTKMSYMFYDCTSLTSVPLFDTSNVTNMSSMFDGCTSLTSVPLFDTSKVTSMGYMFMECTSLTSVPLFDTSKVTDMKYMFEDCHSLTSVPLFDTSKVTQVANMFYDCHSLTSVPLLDARKMASPTNMFTNCLMLTDCYLRNIKTNLQVGSGTSWGHLLTLDSLKHLIYELRDTGSLKTLTVGSANLEKLANIYVKTIDITDEMRAEDDLIDEKLPYVVCESTDEGAVLITDYVTEKNWTLK